MTNERFIHPLEVREIIQLCDRFGFGRVMQIVAEEWAKRDPVGALTVGPAICYSTSVGDDPRDSSIDVVREQRK